MRGQLNQEILNQLVGQVATRKYIYGAVFQVLSDDENLDLTSASGELKADSPYYIASINKLFISALILKLSAENKFNIHDKISKYLPGDVVRGLHVHQGTDYSNVLSVAHLLSHTSGLPCYLTDRQANGKKAMAELEAGVDQAWPMERVIQEVKRMKTHFPPGKEGRAKYSDTNYQILSLIIENISGEPANIVLKNLFRALNLRQTAVCEDAGDVAFAPIRYKSEIRHLPLFLASTKNDIISTAKDQMTFLRAFFGGYFFPKEKVNDLAKWNRIFFPFSYGIGIQKFHLPRLLSPFQPVPEMVGHSGSTGSVAFYVPELGLSITGTTNQQARPSAAFQTMIKIIRHARK